MTEQIVPKGYRVIRNPIEYPSGNAEPQVFIPGGSANMQLWWCHTMMDYYTTQQAYALFRDNDAEAQEVYRRYTYFYAKKLKKELYRKRYYEEMGWENFGFRIFGTTVVECTPMGMTYHAWVGIRGTVKTVLFTGDVFTVKEDPPLEY